MSSAVPSTPVFDKANMAVEKSADRDRPIKKSPAKVPKRIHKAKREKMKREHLNDLFLSLANALEFSGQNNGKACVLTETTRVVKDLRVQIESLKRENETLLSESQYVTMDTKEIQDENSALQAQIGKLQSEIKEKSSKLDLNVGPLEYQHQEMESQFPDNLRLPHMKLGFQQGQILNPMYVIPFGSDQVYSERSAAEAVSKPTGVVSKPLARYPTQADTWASQLLEQQPERGKELEHNGTESGGNASTRP